MSQSINKAIVVGRIGRDPEVKYLPSGSAVCELSIATEHTQKDKDPETTWHRAIVFGKFGETIGKLATKGQQIYIEGRMHHRKYTHRDGGERQIFEIVVDQAVLLGNKPGHDADAHREASGSTRKPDAAETAREVAKRNIRQPSFDDAPSAFSDLDSDKPF